MRASADQPGGWVVQETFRLEAARGRTPPQAHRDGSPRLCRRRRREGCRREPGEVFELDGRRTRRGRRGPGRRRGRRGARRRGQRPAHQRPRDRGPHHPRPARRTRSACWRAAHAANPRTALALVSAYPYAVTDADAACPPLLWTAHGGQAAGTALARVLAGDVSPAGRLPQTWYADDADLPDLLDYDIIGSRQTYLYFEGTPLYPFGHGLSYTSFAYGGPHVPARRTATLHVSLHGHQHRRRARPTRWPSSTRAPWTRRVAAPAPRARRPTAGSTLAPGASGGAVLRTSRCPPWASGTWRTAAGACEPGPYELLAGASSEDIRLRTTVLIDGEPAAPAPGPATRPGSGRLRRAERHRDRRPHEGGGRRGDARPAARTGELVFRDCDFGRRRHGGDGDGGRRGHGRGVARRRPGARRAARRTRPTPGPYDYTTLARRASPPTGVHDVHLRLRGPLRLAHVGFSG